MSGQQLHTPAPEASTTVASVAVDSLRCGEPDRRLVDEVGVEAPLEVRIAGKPATVLMRTPGHDEELVRGFLFNEGIIHRADDIVRLRRPDGLEGRLAGNVIEVDLSALRHRHRLERPFFSSSSCGACGKASIDSLTFDGPRLESSISVSRDWLRGLPEKLRAAQPVFARTGGVHASGLFDAGGELIAVREDVGRHNALDKLIGWALSEGRLPLKESVLMLSGRVSYELVQKAASASIALVAAVGAPSSLAVELAERFGITLIGFLRPDGMNGYTHAGRVR